MGDITYIWLFGTIALFILLIALVNFVNLSTARSAYRAKEVGLRKVLGSYKKQLIYDLDLDKDLTYSFEEKLFGTKVSWEPLLSVRAAKKNLKVSEIPGDEPAREGGERKLQVLRWGAAYYWEFWRELFVWR